MAEGLATPEQSRGENLMIKNHFLIYFNLK